jgi:hypothetical protein
MTGLDCTLAPEPRDPLALATPGGSAPAACGVIA